MNTILEESETREETTGIVNVKNKEISEEEEKDSLFPDTQIKIDLSGAKYEKIRKLNLIMLVSILLLNSNLGCNFV